MFHSRLAPTCTSEVPLVNGSNPIPDSYMTASSAYDDNHGPRYARLNNIVGAGAWCPTLGDAYAQQLTMHLQVSR